jgi:hypothetical protein
MIGRICAWVLEFSNANKLQITEGLTLVYGDDNKSYYTGLTSVGKGVSVLVDTRTKEATFINKVTEYAAQSSAQGKVQEKDMRHHYPYRIISIVFPHM